MTKCRRCTPQGDYGLDKRDGCGPSLRVKWKNGSITPAGVTELRLSAWIRTLRTKDLVSGIVMVITHE